MISYDNEWNSVPLYRPMNHLTCLPQSQTSVTLWKRNRKSHVNMHKWEVSWHSSSRTTGWLDSYLRQINVQLEHGFYSQKELDRPFCYNHHSEVVCVHVVTLKQPPPPSCISMTNNINFMTNQKQPNKPNTDVTVTYFFFGDSTGGDDDVLTPSRTRSSFPKTKRTFMRMRKNDNVSNSK